MYIFFLIIGWLFNTINEVMKSITVFTGIIISVKCFDKDNSKLKNFC